ncbi:MAG: sigma-54-dependent Fis family transcriptional regulator, partial [Deltaproteobacteria bacterium CG_4_9_14_3_um_filter_51_14]
MKPNLLIVDDDEDLRTQMKWALASDYGVFLADCREGALDLLKRISPPVMTLDLGLPPDPAGV